MRAGPLRSRECMPWRPSRAVAALLVVTVMLQAVWLPASAVAADLDTRLMLADEPRTGASYGLGAMFTGLTLVSLAVVANDYNESQKYIKKAKADYANYSAASTAQAALDYRAATTRDSNRAQAYESTANGALVFSTLFFLAAVASFRSGGERSSLLLSAHTVGWEFHF
jgi:hypothetical protein